jgi:hypothetical protein
VEGAIESDVRAEPKTRGSFDATWRGETSPEGVCRSKGLSSFLITNSRRRKLWRRGHGAALLEAFTAVNRAAKPRLEGDRSFLAALRAHRRRLSMHVVFAAGRGGTALGLATLAPPRLILEAFVGEEQLLARSKYKIFLAIGTL